MFANMTLGSYLKEKTISPEDFGKKVGASGFGVRKWIRGERIPRAEAMRRIEVATGGLVKPADFFTASNTKSAA